MPILYNATQCLNLGYNASPCWVPYNLGLANVTNASTVPNIVGVLVQNLPWFGLGIFAVTYAALFILFYRSGGREKFIAIGIAGFLANIVYAQIGVLGIGISEIAAFAFSIFVLIVSIVAYALVKDSGE
ncbi:MAG: hypothetical protein QXN16_03885 [Candidatus Micrarchaeaceae archaeon]